MPANSTKADALRGYIIPMGGEVEKVENPVILERFFELSGGSNANILVIPTASELSETGPDYAMLFESMGARSRLAFLSFKTIIDATLPESHLKRHEIYHVDVAVTVIVADWPVGLDFRTKDMLVIGLRVECK